MRRPGALVAIAFPALAVAMAGAPNLRQTAGPGERTVLDNPTAQVTLLSLPPAAREAPHAHPSAAFTVLLSRGTVAIQKGEARDTASREPGDVDFVDAGVAHALLNGGNSPLDAAIVMLKSARARGGTAPPAPAPPGITRRPLLDNAEATVMRIDFSPAARETVHTHPYDLLVIPVRGALLELQLGTEKETRGYAPGEPIFIPRNQPHAVANPSSEAFAVIAFVIK